MTEAFLPSQTDDSPESTTVPGGDTGAAGDIEAWVRGQQVGLWRFLGFQGCPADCSVGGSDP